MSKEVDKIRINISQKINLGNYETRDYSLGVDIVGFDSKSAKEVQDAIDFGKKLCLDDVGEYYQKVKQGLQKGVALATTTDKKYLDLEKKIDKSENEDQLRTLQTKIEEIKDLEMQKVMQKKFNLKLISIKKV